MHASEHEWMRALMQTSAYKCTHAHACVSGHVHIARAWASVHVHTSASVHAHERTCMCKHHAQTQKHARACVSQHTHACLHAFIQAQPCMHAGVHPRESNGRGEQQMHSAATEHLLNDPLRFGQARSPSWWRILRQLDQLAARWPTKCTELLATATH